MANPFLEPHKGLRRAYDAVQPKLKLPKLPTEPPRNLRMAGDAGGYTRLRGVKDAARQTFPSTVAGVPATAVGGAVTTAKSPGLLSRAGGAVSAVGRGLGTLAGGAAVAYDAHRTKDALDKGNNLQAGIRAAETGLSALSMVPGARLPAAALRMASGLTFGDGGWINRRGSHFDPQNPSKDDADWAVLANSIDPTKGATLEDTQRAMREATARGQTIDRPRQGLRGVAAALTQGLPEFLDKAGRYSGQSESSTASTGHTAAQVEPELEATAPYAQHAPAVRDTQSRQTTFDNNSISDTDRISTVPGFFEGGENSAFARGERYVQSLRDMQNLRAQLMDQGKPTPGTAIIGPASGGNAALDLRRLADEQRNTPSAVVDRLRRGEINDRVAASLLDSHDRAQERLMRGELGRREQDMNLRAEQERAALRLASESGTRGRKGGEEGEGLGFKDQLALAKFQADLAKDQREQRNADREFARNAENDEYGRRSAQQRDFMDRVDREFTELDKDGKPFINTARRNEFLRFADQGIADSIRKAEADLQANPNNSEARAQLQALLRNPYQTIDPRQYRELAALQEVDRLAREHGSYVASGTADGKRIIGKEDSWIPFKEYYVTRDGSRVPTYVTDYQDGGYFSRAWKPKRTDLRTVMDIHPRG